MLHLSARWATDLTYITSSYRRPEIRLRVAAHLPSLLISARGLILCD